MEQKNISQKLLPRITGVIRAALKPSLSTIRFLISITVPVSFGVFILDITGILSVIAVFFNPLMQFLGLPGESGLVFVSSILLNIYSAIAVMGTLHLNLREVTLLAVMCLIAHSIIVETMVMKKTGSSITKMVLLRIGVALFAAWILHWILLVDMAKIHPFAETGSPQGPFSWSQLPLLLKGWFFQNLRLIIKMSIIVFLLMVLQKIMEAFHWLEALGRLLAPLMQLFGLSPNHGFCVDRGKRHWSYLWFGPLNRTGRSGQTKPFRGGPLQSPCGNKPFPSGGYPALCCPRRSSYLGNGSPSSPGVLCGMD